MYSRVQTRQPTHRSMSEITVLKIQSWGGELIDSVGMNSCWQAADDESNEYGA